MWLVWLWGWKCRKSDNGNNISHFSQEGEINLIPSQYCYNFIDFLIDTPIDHIWSHIAIWSYGYMAKIWSYIYMALMEAYKILSRFDLPVEPNQTKRWNLGHFGTPLFSHCSCLYVCLNCGIITSVPVYIVLNQCSCLHKVLHNKLNCELWWNENWF